MRKDLLLLGIIALLVIGIAVYFTKYYGSDNSGQVVKSNSNSAPAPARANAETLIRSDSPTLGPADAKVTIVEFLDPECESCAAFAPVVKAALKTYEGRVRLVIRYMPLHPNSLTAATFTEAAGEQGKYWEAQELLFKMQPEWGTKHGPAASEPKADINALFRKYAAELGLDSKKMDAAFAENRFAAKLERDKKDGQSIGVRQTPTIFVNGLKLGKLDERAFRMLLEQELKN